MPETSFRRIYHLYRKKFLGSEREAASQIGHLSALVTHLAVAPCEKAEPPLSGLQAHLIFRTHAARFFPKLFSALVLADPVIFPPQIAPGMRWVDGWGSAETLVALCDGAVIRRNGWRSKYTVCCLSRLFLILVCTRTEALQSFKNTPFFATWNPLSLELYVECQLWDDEERRETKLKMSGTSVGGRSSILSRYAALIVPRRKGQYSLGIVDHLKDGIHCRCLTTGLR